MEPFSNEKTTNRNRSFVINLLIKRCNINFMSDYDVFFNVLISSNMVTDILIV